MSHPLPSSSQFPITLSWEQQTCVARFLVGGFSDWVSKFLNERNQETNENELTHQHNENNNLVTLQFRQKQHPKWEAGYN